MGPSLSQVRGKIFFWARALQIAKCRFVFRAFPLVSHDLNHSGFGEGVAGEFEFQPFTAARNQGLPMLLCLGDRPDSGCGATVSAIVHAHPMTNHAVNFDPYTTSGLELVKPVETAFIGFKMFKPETITIVETTTQSAFPLKNQM